MRPLETGVKGRISYLDHIVIPLVLALQHSLDHLVRVGVLVSLIGYAKLLRACDWAEGLDERV